MGIFQSPGLKQVQAVKRENLSHYPHVCTTIMPQLSYPAVITPNTQRGTMHKDCFIFHLLKLRPQVRCGGIHLLVVSLSYRANSRAVCQWETLSRKINYQ